MLENIFCRVNELSDRLKECNTAEADELQRKMTEEVMEIRVCENRCMIYRANILKLVLEKDCNRAEKMLENISSF